MEIKLDIDMKPIQHDFEWAKNYASQVKAQIMSENEQINSRSHQGSGEASLS